MARRREQTKARRLAAQDMKANGMCSLDIVTGAQNLATLSPQDLFDRERPEDFQAAFKRARELHKENWFVRQVVKLQAAFMNYGLRVLPVDSSKENRNKVKKWMAVPAQRGALLRYINTVWSEYLLQDNVVSFWRKEKEVTPFILLGETCRYTDAMGIERLEVNLGYKKDQLMTDPTSPEAHLTSEEIQRYTRPKLVLDEAYDEYFRVLTRAHRGQGFTVPALYTEFRTLSQAESMEVGESMLAYAGRLVLRFHRLGFEVRSGANAAKQSEYLWKKKRAEAIEQFFRGRMGFAETTGQFDHKIDYIWTDPKLYDDKKWNTIITRLLWWAGPVGFMMMAKSVSPFLLPMLKTQAEADRPMVGAHLEEVINEGFDLPVDITLRWSNRCFYDSRLAWDMVKALMQQGPLSLTTGLREGGFDDAEEAELKSEEARSERDPELLPKFDPNHGKRPAEPAGRRTGVADGTSLDVKPKGN